MGPRWKNGCLLKPWLRLLILGFCTLGLVILSPHSARLVAQDLIPEALDRQTIEQLPLKRHPLPVTLAKLASPKNLADYFDQVKPTLEGYLLWSRFPVKVYLQPPAAHAPRYDQAWLEALTQVVKEWSLYLPLQIVDNPLTADITIARQNPKVLSGERVRSAETRYETFINAAGQLDHRCQILIRPRQSIHYSQAAVRHELGHALGIWGHSHVETDALYFSQVRFPPPISARDINTLRRVYEQPTRLGWPVPRPLAPET